MVQRGRGLRVMATATAVCLVASLLAVAPAGAKTVTGKNGVRLKVASATVTGTGEVRITVKGSGYSTTHNNRFGIYLSFGEKPVKPGTKDAWARDPLRYYDKGDGRGTKWIRPGTASGPNQAVLQPNGTFETRLSVKRSYLARNGKRYPRSKSRPLGILTYAAHGTETARNAAGKRTGYSQYAFLQLTFRKPAGRSAAVPAIGSSEGPRAPRAAGRTSRVPDALRSGRGGPVVRRRRRPTGRRA